MCLVGVVVRRYIDFLILLISTPLVSALFCSSIHTFCSFFIMGHRLLINAVVICNIIGASLREPQTYHTAVQNPPDIILYIIDPIHYKRWNISRQVHNHAF